MSAEWTEKRVLITVRTYPVPATKSVEVSCTAGITEDGKWIRLYPVPYRLLDDAARFKKYQWVTVGVKKAKADSRPESYNPRIDKIQIGEFLSSKNEWRARWEIVRPLMRDSMCQIQRECAENGSPTLAIFKPQITRLLIEATDAEWTPKQQLALGQKLMFGSNPKQQLEKIPFDFKYEFKCADAGCKGHRMGCTDWEMGESYRRWRKQYRENW